MHHARKEDLMPLPAVEVIDNRCVSRNHLALLDQSAELIVRRVIRPMAQLQRRKRSTTEERGAVLTVIGRANLIILIGRMKNLPTGRITSSDPPQFRHQANELRGRLPVG